MATGAAAVIAKARRGIQHDFFSQDAVRPERAIPFDARRRVERRVFDRWRRAGRIREEQSGRYWLDVAPTIETCASGTTGSERPCC